jgi:hypothetical protein
VPLSEHEQRLLEQMERALYAEDPKFATSMRNQRTVVGSKRRVALGVMAFLAGVGLLLAGVTTRLVPVGVVGFLAMLGGIWLAVAAMRPTQEQAPQQGTGAPGPTAGPSAPRRGRSARSKQRSGESLSDRMEQRWRRRRETGDF